MRHMVFGAEFDRSPRWCRIGIRRLRDSQCPTPFGSHLLLLGLSLIIVFGTLLVSTAPASAEVGVPVIIDGFGNSAIAASPFTRSVSYLPAPGTSTTPQGTFSQSNGVGTMTMSGSGNGTSGVTLTYTPTAGPVDLTSDGSNNQILVDFALINQIPYPPGSFADGVGLYITVVDSGVSEISPLDSIGNYYAFNAAFPFSGFSGDNFNDVTSIAVTFVYPESGTGGGSLTVQTNELWATPGAAAPPSTASPAVTAPATAKGTTGATVDFSVAFSDDQGAAPVTYDPPSDIGVRAQDLKVSGSAFGSATPKVSVSGGPSTYTLAVSGMTQTGGIKVHVPAGIVDDAWTQPNAASSDDPVVVFRWGLPQTISFTPPASGSVGTTANLSATGGASGNPVVFVAGRAGVCSVSGTDGATVKYLKVGNCKITATQKGDGNNFPAPPVTKSIKVARGTQAITFTPPTSGLKGTMGSLSASGGGSGNPVVFKAGAAGVCSVSGTDGTTVTYLKTGTCRIIATQSGDADYTAAHPVTEMIKVST
jgi:hypothetical protein